MWNQVEQDLSIFIMSFINNKNKIAFFSKHDFFDARGDEILVSFAFLIVEKPTSTDRSSCHQCFYPGPAGLSYIPYPYYDLYHIAVCVVLARIRVRLCWKLGRVPPLWPLWRGQRDAVFAVGTPTQSENKTEIRHCRYVAGHARS